MFSHNRIDERNHQRRRVTKVLRHTGKRQATGNAGFDAIRKFEYRAAVGGKYRGCLSGLRARGRIGSNYRHRLVQVLLEQFLRRKQVEIEILFLQPESSGMIDIAQ